MNNNNILDLMAELNNLLQDMKMYENYNDKDIEISEYTHGQVDLAKQYYWELSEIIRRAEEEDEI